MIIPTIHAKGFGAATAVALVLAMAASGASRAEFRSAGHPAHVNALPHQPMRPLQTGTVVAAPAAQAQPSRVMSSAPSVAIGHAEESGHAGDQGHDRGHDPGRRDARIIVIGVPSTYYDGTPTYYAPGYYGDTSASNCAQTYSSYDPQSGTYIGDDGIVHPCP
jgi:hypothetical protein